MVDDLHSEDGLGGLDSHRPRQPRRSGERQRPLADREVPLGQQEQDTRVLSPAVHAWLDGELPEASVRKGDTARDVEFWKQINGEVERRRRVHTPVYLEAQIMERIPQSAPAHVITKWWQREYVVTPTSAIVTGAALVVTAAAVTAIVMAFAR
jgi:hypothetical protein